MDAIRKIPKGTMSCCTEHQSLVHIVEMAKFGLSSFELHLELILDGLEIVEVAGSYG